jgi:hypothetical protein
LTGSIVLVSALFHPETMTGKPFALVSRPMVLCGPSLRSLENPLSGNSPWRRSRTTGWVQPCVRGAGSGDLLPPGAFREHPQPPRHSSAGSPRHASLLQHPQEVQLADRLDDPREHQLAEHLVPLPAARVRTQHPVSMLQRVHQAAHR